MKKLQKWNWVWRNKSSARWTHQWSCYWFRNPWEFSKTREKWFLLSQMLKHGILSAPIAEQLLTLLLQQLVLQHWFTTLESVKAVVRFSSRGSNKFNFLLFIAIFYFFSRARLQLQPPLSFPVPFVGIVKRAPIEPLPSIHPRPRIPSTSGSFTCDRALIRLHTRTFKGATQDF